MEKRTQSIKSYDEWWTRWGDVRKYQHLNRFFSLPTKKSKIKCIVQLRWGIVSFVTRNSFHECSFRFGGSYGNSAWFYCTLSCSFSRTSYMSAWVLCWILWLVCACVYLSFWLSVFIWVEIMEIKLYRRTHAEWESDNRSSNKSARWTSYVRAVDDLDHFKKHLNL